MTKTTRIDHSAITGNTGRLFAFPAFYRRLFLGTLGLDMLLLGLSFVLWPAAFQPLGIGMGLGLLYLLSVRVNSESPLQGAQFALSLGRAMVLALLIVWLGGNDIFQVIVVFCGCFSYKIVLTGLILLNMRNSRQNPVRSG